MLPVGDKVVLEKMELPQSSSGLILGGGGVVYARVVAAGPGVPYGRGEFYSLSVAAGDLVFLPEKEWEAAPMVRLAPRPGMKHLPLRVVHERQILVKVSEEDL
jgi:co-chaperonin GroES (HSP10)